MGGMLIVLVLVLLIGTFLGRYLESNRTRRIQNQLIQDQRSSVKSYQDKVKTLEKDLKKLKGDLGMD